MAKAEERGGRRGRSDLGQQKGRGSSRRDRICVLCFHNLGELLLREDWACWLMHSQGGHMLRHQQRGVGACSCWPRDDLFCKMTHWLGGPPVQQHQCEMLSSAERVCLALMLVVGRVMISFVR